MEILPEVLAELIKQIQSMAPVVWDTYLLQVSLEAQRNILFFSIVLVLFLICTVLAYKNLKHELKHNYADIDEWSLLILSVGGVLFSLYVLMGNIITVMNPAYAAIELLLETIK